jgi:hypothetical protein
VTTNAACAGRWGMVMGELENKIPGVYAVTRDMRETHKAGLGPLYDLAFKILHAPPRAHPPVLFIGIQPGGSKADPVSREMFTWPDRLDYETGQWPLARYVRRLFSDNLDLLMACNATNANFFRAPRDKIDRENPHEPAWQHACPSTRKALEEFCVKQLKIVVGQLRPKAIVVTGMNVLRQSELTPQANKEAFLFGVPAIRVWHTAAQGQTTEIRAARDAAIRKIAGLSP